jgi:hypothetical protein
VVFPVSGFLQVPSGWNFWRKKIISENRDIICSWRGRRGWRYTKYQVNRTNLEKVTPPAAPSVSSGDLVPDVRLTSAHVRSNVTTTDHKTFSFSFFLFAVVLSGGQSGLILLWRFLPLPDTTHMCKHVSCIICSLSGSVFRISIQLCSLQNYRTKLSKPPEYPPDISQYVNSIPMTHFKRN